MRYAMAIYDLDGTLVDTLDDLTDAMNFALNQLGQPSVGRQECREMIGKGLAVFAFKALSERSKHLQQLLVQTMKSRYLQTCLEKTRVYPGTLDVLMEYKKRGLRLGVISNKEHSLTVKIVEHYFGRHTFDIILGQKENMKIKPDPEPVVFVMKEMGLTDPQSILYIGDSEVDVLTAQNSGIDFIGASWGFRSVEQLMQAGAQKIIHKPTDLLSI